MRFKPRRSTGGTKPLGAEPIPYGVRSAPLYRPPRAKPDPV